MAKQKRRFREVFKLPYTRAEAVQLLEERERQGKEMLKYDMLLIGAVNCENDEFCKRFYLPTNVIYNKPCLCDYFSAEKEVYMCGIYSKSGITCHEGIQETLHKPWNYKLGGFRYGR